MSKRFHSWMTTWNNENTGYLISLIEEHPCLWNPKDPDYKNNQYRNSVLEEVSLQMNSEFSVAEIKERFRTMKTVFKKVLKKVKAARSPDTSDPFYQPKWTFYQKLYFLRAVIEASSESQDDTMDFRPTDSPLQPEEGTPMQPSMTPINETPKTNSQPMISIETSIKNIFQPTSVADTSKTIEKIVKKLKREKSDDNGGSNANCFKVVGESPAPNVEPKKSGDRFEKFGEFVGESVRMLGPCADLAMLEIQQVLVKYKYRGTDLALPFQNGPSSAAYFGVRTPSPQMSSSPE